MTVKHSGRLLGLGSLIYIFICTATAAPLSPAERNIIEQQQNLLEQNQL